ncbi:UDP-N-acetylmuramate--L-alanine ligase [Candidatus Parcubacteria bacterium]|nr:UDP-N-acetylmuramate--L-alanine ligase [Candidatus Parcubacteria bacterium]
MTIYFIGIGGIGVSALAQYYLKKGDQVFGSDLSGSEITEMLEKQGAKIFIGQEAKNIVENIDLVIYSPAVQEDNPEFAQAKKLGIKCLSYPQALGNLTKEHFTIAVSGTHGKSSTTSMLALLLIKAGLDPTVIVGTKLKEFGNSNFRAGKSKYLLIEACEHEESFLNYSPDIIVANNIEADHLDYYKNLENIIKAFEKFVNKLPEDGVLIVNGDDNNILRILNTKHKIKKFSIEQEEARRLKEILQVKGEYNVYNALAALAVARTLKIPDEISFLALSEYTGCWRRCDITKINSPKPFILISDYAHHPTEVKACISGVREKFPENKIWVVFQPHQHQRTFYLFDDFVKAFDEADEIVLTEIYDVAGRGDEGIAQKVNGEKLAKAVGKRGNKVHFIQDFQKIPEFLKEKIDINDIVVIMGAGSIYNIVSDF